MFEFTQTQSGQTRRYGDTVYAYDVASDLPAEEVKAKCLQDLSRGYEHIVPQHEHRTLGFPACMGPHYVFTKTGENAYHFSLTFPWTG